MSKPKVLHWAIAIPLACAVGIGLAFGSWHLRDTDSQQYFGRGSVSAKAGSTGATNEHQDRARPGPRLPALVNQQASESLPSSREPFNEQLEQEKQRAANDLLTSYILSKEELPRLNEPAPRPPDHPLVEALINQPNHIRKASLTDQSFGMRQMNSPGAGSELGILQALTDMARRGRLDGYSSDVLRRAGEVFNSPAFDPVRADANAASHLTVEQVSRLLNASQDLQRELERRR